jgi:predicted GIY-YIG superfamily endonuclease
MKKYYVYELWNELGQVLYVGCTISPEKRYRQHVETKPLPPHTGFGMFYKQNVKMHIVKEFTEIKEAHEYEAVLKYEWGLRDEIVIDNRAKGLKNTPIEVHTKAGEFVGKYRSQMETAEKLNLKQPHINDCLRGNRKSHRGYIFSYA